MGVLSLDDSRRVLSVNEAAAHWLSCLPEQAGDSRLEDLFIPDDHARLHDLLASASEGDCIIARPAFADAAPVRVTLSSLTRDRPLLLLSTAPDAASFDPEVLSPDAETDSALAVPRFAPAPLLLSAIVESSEDAIFSKDLDGRLLSWNRGAERLYGYTAEEVVGQSVALLAPPERVDEIPQIMERLRRGERIEHYETTRMTRDGRRLRISLAISPLRNEAGVVMGASVIARDVTERARLEEALRQRAEELAEETRRKDQFLAMLAHELRNPLAPVLNAIHILKLKGSCEPSCVRARDIAERQVLHMARLIDDLIDLSRLNRGKIEIRSRACEVSEILETAAQGVAFLMERRRHTLTVTPPRPPLRLIADPDRLEQILVNLLNNAAKYTDPGGHIALSAERDGCEVVFTVRDNGIGILPEALPHIFDLFAQADQSLDRSRGGLGIGLSLVKRLVTLHGGEVSAHSAGEGQGAVFTVRLPAGEDPSPVAGDSVIPR